MMMITYVGEVGVFPGGHDGGHQRRLHAHAGQDEVAGQRRELLVALVQELQVGSVLDGCTDCVQILNFIMLTSWESL